MVGLLVVMYAVLIRPQAKRRREMLQMQQTLGVGSEVVTIGGLYGTVISTDDETVTLEVAPGVTNRYARAAVARVVTGAGAAPASGEAPTDATAADRTPERGTD